MMSKTELFTRQAVIASIAYVNLLHSQSAEPTTVRAQQPELWNEQLTYAEGLLNWMFKEGFLT